MKFVEQLSSMRKGERNTQLVPLMLRGLGEGLSPQEICDKIHVAHPDMTEAELLHAMQTAQTRKTDRKFTPGEIKIAKAVSLAEIATEEERTFIERTISRCPAATSADIMKLSPIDISKATPREQAMAYCATVFPDDRHFVFTATEESKYHKRTFDTLRFPSVLFREIADGGTIPNYAIANQFTGCPDDWDEAISGDDFDTFRFTGKGSFACIATLATRRLALMEFDALPLVDQARFWVAAIENNLFGGDIRTLVFSGTKSIHALIRLPSAEPTGLWLDKYADTYVPTYDDDRVAKWKYERQRLSRKTETADNPIYRADKACKDPTRLTRFAGGTRICKDGTRRIQRILWCAKPTANDIPIIVGSGDRTFYSKGYGRNGDYYKC